jgi:hypothetical protein
MNQSSNKNGIARSIGNLILYSLICDEAISPFEYVT